MLSKVAFAATPDANAMTPASGIQSVPAFLGSSPQTLPPLPFAENALEPVISARTVSIHYGKHHRAYFDNLHKLVAGTPLEQVSLEEVIVTSHDQAAMADIFNNAAQAWNHNFYWNSLSPSKVEPSANVADRPFDPEMFKELS